MAEYPRTVLEFRDWFADDAACRDYLARLRWPEGFCCPICGTPIIGSRRGACVTAGGAVADASAKSLEPAIAAAIEVGSQANRYRLTELESSA